MAAYFFPHGVNATELLGVLSLGSELVTAPATIERTKNEGRQS
jgi:hypothetical protein